MSRIAILDPETANRIAAGEVVERPLSVVKELVENSLDAGAGKVLVALREGGRESIRVVDDGCGMSPEELRLAVLRHATSKIRRAEDLYALRTLGFRGEALPSIAAVSELELRSRPSDSQGGWRLLLDAGAVTADEPCGTAPGTWIEVRRLFHNTPPRRRQLRSPAAELSAIRDLLTGFACAHPRVAFRLEQGGEAILQTHGEGRLEEVALALFGRETAQELIPLAREGVVGDPPRPARLTGLIGRPAVARSSRRGQHLIVNGRLVQSLPIRSALEEAFRHLLPHHRYPFAILILECDPGQLEVNVHPSKLTIRFADEPALCRLVYRAAQEALAGAPLIRSLPLGGVPSRDLARGVAPNRVGEARPAYREDDRRAGTPWQAGLLFDVPAGSRPELRPWREEGRVDGEEEAAAREVESPHPSANGLPPLRLIGRVQQTYILAEGPDGLYVIDQHAAHERLQFERFLRGQAESRPPVQVLAVPEAIPLEPDQFAAWERHREVLERWGFGAEPFGGHSLLLRQVPLLFAREGYGRQLRDLLDQLRELPIRRDQGLFEEDLARLTTSSCKSAVKAHDRLSLPELERLLADLARAESPYTCPHGRPVLLKLTYGRLAHYFER